MLQRLKVKRTIKVFQYLAFSMITRRRCWVYFIPSNTRSNQFISSDINIYEVCLISPKRYLHRPSINLDISEVELEKFLSNESVG